MVAHLSATEHGFSAKRSPDQAEKIPLASPTKRVIFALRLGDNMAEKQGMFSASFFLWPLFPENFFHFKFELLLGLF
jgi:hypothetical protein